MRLAVLAIGRMAAVVARDPERARTAAMAAASVMAAARDPERARIVAAVTAGWWRRVAGPQALPALWLVVAFATQATAMAVRAVLSVVGLAVALVIVGSLMMAF